MGASTASMVNSIIISVFGSALAFLATLYWTQRAASIKKAAEIAADHQLVLSRVAVLESQLALVNQAVVPISTAFQAILIKELTHDHHPEMDELMIKVGPPNVLNEDEQARLIKLLKLRTMNMSAEISPSERDAAMILPAVMVRARAEQAVLANAEELKLKLVTVAAVIGVPTAGKLIEEGESPDSKK